MIIYFPRGNEGAYWPNWPVDMPSSRETSPSPDARRGLAGNPDDSPPSGCGGGGSIKGSNSKRVEGKRCGVCGDRALGYNFNAITCESCKAFFRRNALKNKEHRCPFNDECEVTAVTRRFCQRCRLRKCFEVGMKKEWIMTEEEKRKKKKKIEENRARKIEEMDNSSGGGPGSESPSSRDEDHLPYFAPLTPVTPATPIGGEQTPAPPLRPAAIVTAKPKAVVVGRVRVEEKEPKVRKTIALSDVHSTKNSPPKGHIPVIKRSASHFEEDSTSPFSFPPMDHSTDMEENSVFYHQLHPTLPQPSPPSELSPSLQRPSYYPVLPQHPQFPSKSSSSQPPLPLHPSLPRVSISPESLVAGLLRTPSHGSAEESAAAPWNCHTAEKYSTLAPGVIIKREKEEDPTESPEASPQRFSSPSFPHSPKEDPLPPPSPFPTCPPNQEGQSDLPPNPSCPHSQGVFEFSVREALNMIQPGCKERGPPSPSPFSSHSNVIESIMNTAISAEYSAFSLLVGASSCELNQVESLKIAELLDASRGLNSPLCEDPNYKDLPNPSLINVINLTEIAIRRLIKMAKKISCFKTFCQEDQIALLKGGCTEMMILRSVSAYDPDKDAWKIQHDHERFKNIKLKVLMAAPGNVYEEHKRFMLLFQPAWRQDPRIIALLAAIALFTPDRSNIIHPEAVRHEQSSYMYLLKRYLECKYGCCEGKTNYVKLLEIISHLHILNEHYVRVFLEVNPQEVEPLLIEIFDLKES